MEEKKWSWKLAFFGLIWLLPAYFLFSILGAIVTTVLSMFVFGRLGDIMRDRGKKIVRKIGHNILATLAFFFADNPHSGEEEVGTIMVVSKEDPR